jgi:hypothetical protein
VSSAPARKIRRKPLKTGRKLIFPNFALNSRQSLHWNHLLEEPVLMRISQRHGLSRAGRKKETGAGPALRRSPVPVFFNPPRSGCLQCGNSETAMVNAMRLDKIKSASESTAQPISAAASNARFARAKFRRHSAPNRENPRFIFAGETGKLV